MKIMHMKQEHMEMFLLFPKYTLFLIQYAIV